MMIQVLALVFLVTISTLLSYPISVENDYKLELNIKIQGTGAGGCDVLLQSGQNNTQDCWCLGGTINYSFCAYKKSLNGGDDYSNNNVGEGKCPKVTGESLVCSDLQSLGNCYNIPGYSCYVDVEGLCHCSSL